MALKEKIKKLKPRKPDLKKPDLRKLLPGKPGAKESEPEKAEPKLKKSLSAHGAAAASAVVAVTAAGVLVGGAYASPEEILSDGPEAVIQTLDTAAAQPESGGAGTDEVCVETDDEKKRGVYAGVRSLLRSAPAGVRALVGVPLWGIGTAAIILASTLWGSVLSPAALALLSWLAVALMAALIFTLAVKTVFPDLPLRKILNRRSILTIVSLCLLFGLADAVLPFFWEDYAAISKLLRAAGAFVCTAVPVAFFVRRHGRKKTGKVVGEIVETEPAPSMEEQEAAARKLVAELADSVCPKAR